MGCIYCAWRWIPIAARRSLRRSRSGSASCATSRRATVRSEGELRLQAVLELIAGTASVVAEVLVVVDERTVREGPHDHSMCETEAGVPLPIGLGIELSATAKITTAVIGVDGRAAGMACAARTASRPQRRALARCCTARAHSPAVPRRSPSASCIT